jgi:hypothetical protein
VRGFPLTLLYPCKERGEILNKIYSPLFTAAHVAPLLVERKMPCA